MKKVLLLCSSHNDLGTIRGLKKLGLYIVCTGNINNLPGQKLVDKWICADYSDRLKILNIAIDNQVDYICPCCNDFGVYTASYVAEKMKLPGYDSYKTTLLLHNKDKFKQLAKELNINTPSSYPFTHEIDAINFINQSNLPLIVKPVDCSAGNGVSVVFSKTDNIEKIVGFAFEKSRKKRVVIEPYIKGSQHGVCTFLINKRVVAICTNNEYSFLNPYRVEIDTYPSTLPVSYVDGLIIQIEKIANYLNLKDGIFHLQCIYDGEKAWIIEVMRRTLGNMYHVLSNQLTGFDWEYWEARARCGFSCERFPILNFQQGFYAYKTVLANRNGVISRICVPKELEQFTFSEYWIMKVGETVSNYKSQPIGFIFLMFSSEEKMKSVLINHYSNDYVTITINLP